MPTIQDITSTRRAGQLTEALKMAEELFAAHPDKYSSSALFWCLKELYPKQTGEDRSATVERMKALYEEYNVGDEFMQRSLTTALRSALPNFQIVNDACRRAKEGDNPTARYNEIVELFSNGEVNPESYQDFGWLIYYALRATPSNEVNLRKNMLHNYLQLNLPKPSMLHSMMLAEAVKIEYATPLQFRISDFMNLWGFENLRKEDWEQYHAENGHTSPSLVEKLIGVYAKEVETDHIVASEEFLQLVDEALNRYPQNQNLPYSKAKVLISQNRLNDAVGCYRDLILKSPSKHYLWHQLSKLVEDVDLKMGLLSKALTTGAEEQYVGKVHLAMAELLIEKGDLPHAKYEIEKYRIIYQEQGWKIKNDYKVLASQLADVEATSNNSSVYSAYKIHAEEFIYSHLPDQVAVKVADRQVDDRNRPGRRFTVWTLRTKNGTIQLKKPAKFGLQHRMLNGAIFKIRVYDNKIVWIEQSEFLPQTDWIKEIQGEVRIRQDKNGRQYSIVDNAYVGEKLLKGITDGQNIQALAIKQDDGRWAAVSLYN